MTQVMNLVPITVGRQGQKAPGVYNMERSNERHSRAVNAAVASECGGRP
jgi:hypothetical protein